MSLLIESMDVVVTLFSFQACLWPTQSPVLACCADWVGFRNDSTSILETYLGNFLNISSNLEVLMHIGGSIQLF